MENQINPLDFVYYCETSPSCLRWSKDITYPHNKNPSFLVLKRKAGDVAGTVSGGYYNVTIKGKSYKIHRLIYLLKYNTDIDNLFIDHIDGDRLNNKIENLRVTSSAGNARNRGKQRNCANSGITGVYWHSRDNTWSAVIRYTALDQVKKETKVFNPSDYQSIEDAMKAAAKWRTDRLLKINNKLKDLNLPEFTSRHIEHSIINE